MKIIGCLLVCLILACSCTREQNTVVSLTNGHAQGVYADKHDDIWKQM